MFPTWSSFSNNTGPDHLEESSLINNQFYQKLYLSFLVFDLGSKLCTYTISLTGRWAFITVRNCIQILFCHTTTSKEFQLSKKWNFALSLF